MDYVGAVYAQDRSPSRHSICCVQCSSYLLPLLEVASTLVHSTVLHPSCRPSNLSALTRLREPLGTVLVSHQQKFNLSTGRPYSQAVTANGMVFVSGQIPLTPAGELAATDVGGQTVSLPVRADASSFHLDSSPQESVCCPRGCWYGYVVFSSDLPQAQA